MKNKTLFTSAITLFFGMLAGIAIAEVPTVIFDTDLALPSMQPGDGSGTPVCIDDGVDGSGLLVAGCLAAEVPGPKGDKGDKGDIGPQGPAGVIAPDSVTSAHIVNGTIIGGKGGDILANTITSSELGAGSVTSSELATNSVYSAELAADSVGASEIAAGVVSSSELAENVVFGKKSAGGSVSLHDSSDAETILLDGETGRINFGTAEYIEDGGSNLVSTGDNAIETKGYRYTTAKTGYLFVPPAAFSGNPSSTYIYIGAYIAWLKGTGLFGATAHAPVYLPDGAIVTIIDCYVGDESATRLLEGYIRFFRKSNTSASGTLLGEVVLNTTASYNLATPITKSHTLATPETVSTSSKSYNLILWMGVNSRDTFDVNFQGCRIKYSITTLDP